MKWIGQHIWDFISRFRSDVYLESVADPGSDTDKFLVIDANNKVGYRTGSDVLTDIGGGSGGIAFDGSTANGVLTYKDADEATVEANFTYDGVDSTMMSTASSSPNFSLANINTDDECASIAFSKVSSSSSANNDDIGDITWLALNDNDQVISYAKTLAEIADVRDGKEAGKYTVKVAASNGATSQYGDGLVLEGNGEALEIDATIGAGAASTTTVAGVLAVTESATFGGGYGSTGATISTAGVASFDGAILSGAGISCVGGISCNGQAAGGGYIRLHEDTDNGTDYVAIRAPASISTSFTLYLPTDDGNADEFLQTDGSGNLSWAEASGGGVTSDPYSVTQIKVMPSEFIMNDDYNRAPVLVEDDTSNILGIKAPSAATELYAWVKIPSGYKATHAQVYSQDTTSSAVTIKSYNYQTGADNNVSSTTGNLSSSIDITDIPASTTQDLVIKVAPASTTTLIYGALITIATV
jgi:hypothetical protein